MPVHRSLIMRLLAASMLIALCAIAATAWLAVRITTRAVTQEQSGALSADTDVYDALIEYGATHTGWDGVRVTVRRLADLTGRRIVVTTMDRAVIADSAGGPLLPGTVPTATVDPLYLDAGVARNSARRIDPRAVGPYRLTGPERDQLRVLADQQATCLRAMGLPAEVVQTPSGRPTVRLVRDDLDERVWARCDVARLLEPVPSERQPLAELTALVHGCLGEQNVVVTPLFGVRSDAPRPRTGGNADPDRENRVRTCIEESRRAQLKPYVARPALLFITGPATTTPATVNLSRANTLRITGMTAVVLALACAVTILVGLRLVRPLRTLADATRQPAGREIRVPVTTRDEIGNLAVAFNDLSDRRLALERQRKAMVNDIAHELRTPLTNIRTWLEAARDGVVEVDARMLDLLVDEAVLLHHVIDDLRDLAAADAGSLRLHPEPTAVDDLLGQVIEAHRGAAEAGGVALTLRADAEVDAHVDPVRLRQLAGNLVANAIRHTPPGGAVTVRVEGRGDRLTIEVADTGSGIAAADLPRVFDRFWRADGARGRDTGGSGLGLAIARQLARAHGGDITATSRPGHGSAFTVDLPAAVP